MSKPSKIEIDWLEDADTELAAMHAIKQVMDNAICYGSGDIDEPAEKRIARWFASKYGGTE